MRTGTKTNQHHRFLFYWLLIFLSSIIAGVVLSGCSVQAEDKKDTPPVAASAGIPVDAYVVKAQSAKEEMEVAGSLAANQEVAVASELMRKIVRVHVKEGNVVRQGDLLFQLDDTDLQARLEQLQQREKLAALNEARLKDLIEHDAAIQQDYDQASTNLKVLQAEIRELLVTISKTRIRAPFDGRIGIIRAYTGALVSPSTLLTTIVDDAQIKVEFSIPEKYAAAIPVGSTQLFTVESDSKTYSSKVIARESVLNENTRTLLIRAITPNPGKLLLPGQSARVKLTLSNADDALMVVTHALIPSVQGYSVFKASNKQVSLVPVEIGQRGATDVQVLKGLSAGDTIVTTNLLRLSPGAAVEFATLK